MVLYTACKDREFSGNVGKKTKGPALTDPEVLRLPKRKPQIEDTEYLYLSKFPPFIQAVISVKESFYGVLHV